METWHKAAPASSFWMQWLHLKQMWAAGPAGDHHEEMAQVRWSWIPRSYGEFPSVLVDISCPKFRQDRQDSKKACPSLLLAYSYHFLSIQDSIQQAPSPKKTAGIKWCCAAKMLGTSASWQDVTRTTWVYVGSSGVWGATSSCLQVLLWMVSKSCTSFIDCSSSYL